MIDLRDTEKSRYFAIAKFNNCFITRSPSLFFDNFDQLKMSNHSMTAQGSDLPFSYKSVVSITLEQNIICSKTLLDSIAHEQTIICRQFL